ncbi:MAG: 3-oxo-tetronate kinase [Pseudomonadota bacterium]
MLIGVIADDFTGASDIANTLAKGVAPEGGLKTAQFSGVPRGDAAADIEAGVISLKSRSAPVADAVSDSLDALAWLQGQGCQQIIFKYCSTFDSTPEGNIGPVAEALAQAMGAKGVIVCPAFPATGRTLYNGHLFVFDKLLNESGMENHPLTPMTDADLRRWLVQQCGGAVGHVALSAVQQGADAVAKALDDQVAAGCKLVVADAVADEDLMVLGEALDGRALVTGGSGIALGLPRNFIRRGGAQGDGVQRIAVAGPEVVLAGSCSGATRGQVVFHEVSHPTMALDVAAVMADETTAEDLVTFAKAHAGEAPLIYSSSTPEQVKATQERFGREAVSAKLDALFATTAQLLVAADYRRIVVAGGETSGAVAQAVTKALGVSAMTIGQEIDPGVPVLGLGDDVALALKSGNFGAEDFFEKALRVMAGGA